MSAKHRRELPARITGVRLLGAGASGLLAVAAFAPVAQAQSPTPAGSTSQTDPAASGIAPASSDGAPSSAAPVSGPPSSDAPTSDAPTSDAPPSDVPPSDVPTSDAPTSDAPAIGAPASSPSVGAAQQQSVRPVNAADGAPAPAYGTRKVYVGVQKKDGSYLPPGATTAGSVITFTESGPNAPTPATTTCTTTSDGAPNPVDSGCPVVTFEGFPAGDYMIGPGDTLTVTQTSAPDGVVPDPAVTTLGPCVDTPDPDLPDLPDCNPVDVTFYDTGLAPEAADDGPYSVLTGESIDLDVSGNDDTHGAPLESVEVAQPEHGTVTVVPDTSTTTATPTTATATVKAMAATPVTGPFHLTYTSKPGYVGPDPFSYTVTTGNGSSTAKVSLSVLAPAPTATDDTASTVAGKSVTVDVTANDDAHNGGPLRLDSVGAPKHGTVRIEGTDVRYTPADGFSGKDTFTYTVATDYGTGTATVSVTVAAPAPTSSAAPSSSAGNAASNSNSSGGGLANTGVPAEELLDAGALLLLAGAGVQIAGRRRRRPRGRHA